MYFKQTEAGDEKKAQCIHEGDGLIERRNLFGSSSNLPIQIEIWELDEGVSEGDHIHGDARPLAEIYYFLEGSGEMTIEGERVLVEKNDALNFFEMKFFLKNLHNIITQHHYTIS